MTSRERFLAACACQAVDRPPLWVMRQAGRYLPEYRELKERYSFLELARTPELAAEVTLQPLRRFRLDAAITFSDILVVSEAMGLPYGFDQGIRLESPLRDEQDVRSLRGPSCVEDLGYVAEAQRLLRRELGSTAALLGFMGSPWTLAAYMIEGSGSENFPRFRQWQAAHPALLENLLEKIAAVTAAYGKLQLAAGVDALQIFDSCANLCAAEEYERWSLRWIRAVIAELGGEVPVILFARGRADQARELAASGATVLGVDQNASLSQVQEQVGRQLAVQGNLDPQLMTGPIEAMLAGVDQILDEMRGRRGHIFNLGHGITPDARLENMEALVERICHG